MVARNQLRYDGGDVGPTIEDVSALSLWKRNLKREVADRKGVDRARVRVEARREHGEIVLHAFVE
ncbi:MAG: hypothetical protein ABEI31_01675 [Halodesulfurarchaeum sp.]